MSAQPMLPSPLDEDDEFYNVLELEDHEVVAYLMASVDVDRISPGEFDIE